VAAAAYDDYPDPAQRAALNDENESMCEYATRREACAVGDLLTLAEEYGQPTVANFETLIVYWAQASERRSLESPHVRTEHGECLGDRNVRALGERHIVLRQRQRRLLLGRVLALKDLDPPLRRSDTHPVAGAE